MFLNCRSKKKVERFEQKSFLGLFIMKTDDIDSYKKDR